MERLLIALDCMPGCRRIIEYLARVLKGSTNCGFVLFHILPTVSPDKLRMDAVQRIERIHVARPDLGGYFWKEDDERNMDKTFVQARKILTDAGFPDEVITTYFAVESGDLADIILRTAAELDCSSIILGRRRISRMKQLLLGRVSGSTLRLAKGAAVWVIEC